MNCAEAEAMTVVIGNRMSMTHEMSRETSRLCVDTNAGSVPIICPTTILLTSAELIRTRNNPSIHPFYPHLTLFSFHFTFIPGIAPSSGLKIYRSLPPGPAARTMPSETPKRILRGARLATITVYLPSRSSGE